MSLFLYASNVPYNGVKTADFVECEPIHGVATTHNPLADPSVPIDPSVPKPFNIKDRVEAVDISGKKPIFNMAIIDAVYTTKMDSPPFSVIFEYDVTYTETSKDLAPEKRVKMGRIRKEPESCTLCDVLCCFCIICCNENIK